MSLAGEKVVVGTASRKVWVWDLRNMGYVQQKRESSLKFQTRFLECFPNRQVFEHTRFVIEYLFCQIRQFLTGLLFVLTSKNPRKKVCDLAATFNFF